MPLTPATLARHELIGLPVAVVAASNPDLVGIGGEVVMETTRTLSIEGREASTDASDERSRAVPGDDGRATRVWQVPKADATFAFDLPDGQTVTVEGERLVSRPARRTERTGDSKWR